MSIKAKLVFIKSVPIGTKVSYSGTFEIKRPTVIGVVPMGYVDGVSRQLSNKGNVLLHGRRCQIIGNICMDQFMIDITDINNPQIGDEVVFLGRQRKELIAAEEIALLLNNDGVMHTCGHDVHVAILLIAAKILSKYRSKIKGKIKFVFFNQRTALEFLNN
ncbi:M20/M25/M40 family metallo-hydrolase [Acetomicrobium sp. UBA5826]|uniref:M20/M25/M40 family metallo-hydrolase n=1 Tax=Acetomicrobium sp. UBA5826 TaxID=1946039 RepID=UPI0025806E46|nr:M20/M25/M40 family metallo-hydrolase [Acetomicrobium sp. UBA5826]